MRGEILALTTAACLVASGCGDTDSGDFDNFPGDIVAGQPAVVVDARFNKHYEGEHWTDGYKFWLDTEECPEGEEPTPGSDVNPECEVKRHKVGARLWRNSPRGDMIVWDGDDRASEVQQRRYRWFNNLYRQRATVLALTVEQCLIDFETEDTVCVTDNVRVGAQTWLDYEIGDTIVFGGEPGEVVSQ